MKLDEKKDLSALAVLKSFFSVYEKWLVMFVISKLFYQPMLPNDQQLPMTDRCLQRCNIV